MTVDFEKEHKCAACDGRLSQVLVKWFIMNSAHADHPALTSCSKCCPRVRTDVCFLTRNKVAPAITALRDAGYDVLIGDHLGDECSDETVFAEVYKFADPDDAMMMRLRSGDHQASLVRAFRDDVQSIVGLLDGGADCWGVIDDNYVPFANYQPQDKPSPNGN